MSDIFNSIIKNINLIKSLIKIFYDFIPSLEVLLSENNNNLLNIIINLIKENSDINDIINNINNNIKNINTNTDNILYLYELFNIYKNIKLLNVIIEQYIYYIDFDIFTDLKLDISNTLKTNININKNNILNEYYKYKNSYDVLNNDLIESIINYFSQNIKNINIKDLFTKIHELYNNSFIFINLNKNTYLKYNDIYYLFNILEFTENNDNDIYNYKVDNLIINLYTTFINKLYEIVDDYELLYYINDIIENNKDNLYNIFNNKKLNVNKNNNINYYNLQTFNFKPITLYNNNEVLNIYELLIKLFDIKSNKINKYTQVNKINKDLIFTELNNLIKLYSHNEKINYAIIIIKKTGNLINYDINNLLNNKLLINNINGINDTFLQKNIMIIPNDDKQNNEDNNIHLINYNDKTQKILLLDTLNYINYRILTNKNYIKTIKNSINDDINLENIYINNDSIIKLLNNINSSRIDNFNNIIQNKIINNINDNSIDDFYNSINTNFDIYSDDSIYNKLALTILNNIMKYIIPMTKNNKKTNLNIDKYIYNILFDNDKIINIFTQTLYDFYFNLTNKNNLNESYLTYVSNVEYIINKFKKDIFDNYNLIIKKYNSYNIPDINSIISEIVKISIDNIINTKTHIYDTMIEKEQLLNAFNN
jgi:hypothetical protein